MNTTILEIKGWHLLDDISETSASYTLYKDFNLQSITVYNQLVILDLPDQTRSNTTIQLHVF